MAADDDDDALMTASELRPLLKLSRRRPVACAIGLTKDRTALVLLDRRLKPRKLMLDLRAKGRRIDLDTSTVRFGRAATAGGSGSKVVTFTVNKDAPGAMRLALLVQLRPAGFQRCEIVVDEAIETELEDEDADAGEDDEDGPIPTQPPGPPAAEAAPAPQPPPPPAPPPAARGDASAEQALRQDLLGLVREIIPVLRNEPQRKTELISLANAGQTDLRSGDLAHAAEAIGSLRAALHHDTPGGGGGGDDDAGAAGQPGGPASKGTSAG